MFSNFYFKFELVNIFSYGFLIEPNIDPYVKNFFEEIAIMLDYEVFCVL